MNGLRIGPGGLVLVVGPSGAGKDTVINGARKALASDPRFVFPRRVVTRPSSTAEDHDSLSDIAFDDAAAKDSFALHWEAHGHKYGILRTINDDITAGRIVVCNVSRTIISEALTAYSAVVIVLITAPSETLAHRLAGRQREASDTIQTRLKRNNQFSELETDYVIENIGTSEQSVLHLTEILKILNVQMKYR